jgi:hypothetical protein
LYISHIRNIGKRVYEPYKVLYYPGGRVTFAVKGEHCGELALKEKEMLERHGSKAILVFGVSVEAGNSTVQVHRC